MSTEKRAGALQARMLGSYGVNSARIGRQKKVANNAISSGSASFDYLSGIGGFARGHIHEVYGATTIGKTSIFGFGAIRGAQELGLVTAVIAVEPRWSDEWAEKHGVNPDTTVVLYPDHLEEAFEMLKDIVYSNEADFILFDSLGGGTSAKSIESDKATQAYGDAALITQGVKRVVPRCYKDNITVMFINQVRQRSARNITWHESPGGEALKHAMMTRVQVKPGAKKYSIKMSNGQGTEDVMVGRDINAVLVKNNAGESMGRTAKFRFFHIESDTYPFGIDYAQDLLNTSKMAGIIEGVGWLKHPVFPDGKINGAPKALEFLETHPEAVKQLRGEYLTVMDQRATAQAEEKKLKVVEGGK